MKKSLSLIQRCRGTRSYGSAAIELAYVVTGRIDAYMSMRLSPWDIAGGAGNCTGGRCNRNKYERRSTPSCLGQDTFIVARPGLHEDI